MSFVKLDETNEKEVVPGFKGKFIHSENLTMAYWTINAGSELPEHKHHHEQITSITNGEFELTIEEETRKLKPGEVAVVPANVKHQGKAITDCKIIDVFYPVREDYKIEK